MTEEEEESLLSFAVVCPHSFQEIGPYPLLLLLLLLVIENTLFLGEQGKNKKMDMKKIVSFGSRKTGSRKTLYLLDPGPIILTSANKIQ